MFPRMEFEHPANNYDGNEQSVKKNVKHILDFFLFSTKQQDHASTKIL